MFLETQEYLEKKRQKKIFWKKCENNFFYKHTNFETIKWEKNARKNLFQKLEYRDKKTMEKYRPEKVRNTFFVNKRISCPKNRGKKTREKKFPKTHEQGIQ